jgi:leader peptidase (prepilin peptidase)/N-methyltransferase
MLAMIGAFLGLEGVLITLFVAALTGATTGILLIARGQLELKSKLPFGLFLSLGGLVALFAGGAMFDSYARWL